MITKTFTPENDPEVFVIMKTPVAEHGCAGDGPGAGHQTTSEGSDTPRNHLILDRG
jgi:hypothetical protein